MRKITVAITVDERMGIAFNKRRQSSDRILISDLVNTVSDNIYITEYSLPLFSEQDAKAVVVADPLSECPDGGCCFVEAKALSEYIDEIDTLIVYNWNRHYPSDMKLDVDFSGYKLVDFREFIGSSHEKITKEIYIKRS